VTDIKQPAKPPRKRSKKPTTGHADDAVALPVHENESGVEPQSELGDAPLAGEFIGKEDKPNSQALVSLMGKPGPDEDEAVVERVEHLNRGVGWTLISAGIIGMVMPGVLGTPFLIMGGLVLWPGNHKKVERWRQGHSPKMFHGAMKQINRFLDDLEKRYPHIDKQ
jgi:hypothetical protein